MIEEQGCVIALEDGYALVQTQRRSSCVQCGVNQGCGTGVIAKLVGQRATEVRALDPVGVKPGDAVVIGIEESALVQGSFLVYAWPLIAMLVTAGIAQWLWGHLGDWPAVLGGLLGISIGFGWLFWLARRIRKNPHFQPVILRRVESTIPLTKA
ncbi:SoxR reducing system RseC family protein [Thiorhodospira sibirica]|uniref:SoxR reducing system RseC family protein n=1 Tax=Thiorhodospira sibirica TaxID=154347 RepID=UPI00022C3A0B|nr:SoxR reducing system RseC family protein [Thiorhodospira sibirica]